MKQTRSLIAFLDDAIVEYRKMFVAANSNKAQVVYTLNKGILLPDGSLFSTGKTHPTPNIIPDSGLEHLAGGGSATMGLVGTGNAVPTANDTGMTNFLNSTTNLFSYQDTASGVAPFFGKYAMVWRFPAGAAQGNVAETGISWTTSGGLLSHSLVKDANSQPTVLPVGATEFLDLGADALLYVPTTDVTGTITLGGTNYGYTLRAALATDATAWSPRMFFDTGVAPDPRMGTSAAVAYNGNISASVTGAPSGASAIATIVASQPYQSNSHYRDVRAYWGLTEGNLPNGINSILIRTTCGAMQVQFSAPIPKDATHELDLYFRTGWDRYAP